MGASPCGAKTILMVCTSEGFVGALRGRSGTRAADMIENVLAKDINALEPRLTRQGYNAKVLAELLNAKPREIKSFLSGQLAPGRTQELQSELLAAGIPL